MIVEQVGRVNVNDIAVLRLKNKILKSYNVDYAKLPTYEFDGVFSVSVFGWGRLDEDGPRSDVLLRTTMKTIRTANCVRNWNPGCLSPDNCQHICASSEYTATGTGDSGGPVVFPDGTVVGLVTCEVPLEFNEAPPREARMFTRLFRYLNFVQFHEGNHYIKMLN